MKFHLDSGWTSALICIFRLILRLVSGRFTGGHKLWICRNIFAMSAWKFSKYFCCSPGGSFRTGRPVYTKLVAHCILTKCPFKCIDNQKMDKCLTFSQLTPEIDKSLTVGRINTYRNEWVCMYTVYAKRSHAWVNIIFYVCIFIKFFCFFLSFVSG